LKVVSIGEIRSMGEAYAAGVRQASAPVVVFGEDHSYPQPDWAEWLLRSHRGPFAAVGPLICNANPTSKVSEADFLIAYGEWTDAGMAGEMEHLPGHNSSYLRAVLLEYGDQLEIWLQAESILHWDLRRKGHRLYFEPAAKTAHVNFERFFPWLRVLFQAGRAFAAFRWRNERWTLSRRIGFTLGATLIPPVRLWRTLRSRNKIRFSALPVLIFGLAIDGLGQMLGYARGWSASDFICFELDREAFNRTGGSPARSRHDDLSAAYR
jgi:hypothetical protein